MLSDRQIARELDMSYDTLLRWRKDKPLLYEHIKEGFELKELIINFDGLLQGVRKHSAYLRSKIYLQNAKEASIPLMALAHIVLPDAIKKASYVWMRTSDENVVNVLAYSKELSLDDSDQQTINASRLNAHNAEDGSQWLLSESMKLSDINTFFEWYLHSKSY